MKSLFTKSFTVAAAVLLIAACQKHDARDPFASMKPEYISNGIVKLGVDMNAGGSIFYFSQVENERNVLNYNDKGRFIQQSYYGEPDGTVWAGMDWCWNPIQGGGTHGEPATVLESQVNSDNLYVKTLPKQWSTGADVPEAIMEAWITLDGDVAKIKFRMTYSGTTIHPTAQQEMPAVFVDATLRNLAYYKGAAPWTDDVLTYCIPGWPNEYDEADEEWRAYVDNSGWGVGVYTPGTKGDTRYRFGDGKSPGPKGSDCSYFAPLRYFSVTPGLVIEYDVYVKIGKIEEIRGQFYEIQSTL